LFETNFTNCLQQIRSRSKLVRIERASEFVLLPVSPWGLAGWLVVAEIRTVSLFSKSNAHPKQLSSTFPPPPFTLDLQPSSPIREVVVAGSFRQLE